MGVVKEIYYVVRAKTMEDGSRTIEDLSDTAVVMVPEEIADEKTLEKWITAIKSVWEIRHGSSDED